MNYKTETPEPTTTVADLRKESEGGEMVVASFFNAKGFALMQRVANMFATSNLVPKEYVGNPANCIIAINLAQRVGADPLMVMQNLVIVHGRPTWSAQYMIATVNSCGRFSSLRYEFVGTKGQDDYGCRAWAIEKETGERLEGTEVTIGLAKAEGWASKNGSKWKTMPDQMLRYRAGAWWTRAYAPELSMGLTTAEEAQDVIDAEKGPDGSYSVDLTELKDAPVQRSPREPEKKAATKPKPVVGELE